MLADAFRDRLRRAPPVLYVILDDGLVPTDELRREAVELAEAGAEFLQLRAKRLGGRALWEIVRALLPELRRRSVPLIINDRADVALAVGADGVHLGIDDLPLESARAILGPQCILGATAHSLSELEDVRLAADYVGYGAVFPTSTRAEARVCGPEALTAACRASTLPVIAIGGLGPDNLSALRGRGVAGVAVASAVSPRRTRPGAVEDLKRQLAAW